MQQINFNNLIDLFQHFATNHLQVKRFGNGTSPQLENVIANSKEFPMLWVYNEQISYPYENQKTFSFNIMVFDILQDGLVNQNDIWNDSVLILEDFIKFLNHTNTEGYYDLSFGSQLKIDLITEAKSERVAGGNLFIDISVPFDGQNDCGIPIVDFPFTLPTINYPNS